MDAPCSRWATGRLRSARPRPRPRRRRRLPPSPQGAPSRALARRAPRGALPRRRNPRVGSCAWAWARRGCARGGARRLSCDGGVGEDGEGRTSCAASRADLGRLQACCTVVCGAGWAVRGGRRGGRRERRSLGRTKSLDFALLSSPRSSTACWSRLALPSTLVLARDPRNSPQLAPPFPPRPSSSSSLSRHGLGPRRDPPGASPPPPSTSSH